jgi:hypothetical protein
VPGASPRHRAVLRLAPRNRKCWLVRDPATPDHIPAYLEPQFAAASAAVPGWDCSATTAKADLKNYGFLLSPLCGLAS